MSTTRPQGPEGEALHLGDPSENSPGRDPGRSPGRTPGLPPGGQTRRLALTGTRGLVGRCRDFTRTALLDWGWLPARTEEQEAVAEDVLLLVSELVTNACLHAGGPSELLLRCTDALLRVEVSDRSPALPVPQTPHQGSRPGGHGLHIVARLSQDWGTAVRAADKTVWLEVRSPLTVDR